MKRLKCFLLVLFLTANLAHAAESIGLQIKKGEQVKNFSFKQLNQNLPVVSYTVKEFAYKKEKTFQGFPTLKLLELGAAGIPQDTDEVLFIAADGFEAPVSLAYLKEHESILAFQEKDRKDRWEKFQHGKEMTTPAPFYLIWREGTGIVGDSNWPFKVVKLELISFKKRYEKMYPNGAEQAVLNGFQTFKNNCMQCHSMNLQGGVVGPELNAPKNVTEYWSKDNLVAFIKNSQSFRYRSKMPPFPRLKEDEIDGILKYLEFMKDRKVAQP